MNRVRAFFPGWVYLPALLLALLGAAQLLRGFTALFSPLVLDYTEMMVAGGAYQLQHHGLAAMYATAGTPYQMPGVQYPPLFMVLVALLNWLTGLSLVGAARFWSFAGYVGSALMAGLLVKEFRSQEPEFRSGQWSVVSGQRKIKGPVTKAPGNKNLTTETQRHSNPILNFGLPILDSKDQNPKSKMVNSLSPQSSVLSSSSFILHPSSLTFFLPFCFWPVIIFIHTARVDPVALFFTLVGVWLYVRTLPVPGKELSYRALIGVAALLALAAYTKQTYLAAPAAIFFHLLLFRRTPRKAFAFGFGYAGLVAAGYALFALLSDGAFLSIFDPARAGRFIFNYAPGMVAFFLLDHLPLIALALVVLIWQWRQGQRFFPLYTFFAALSCVTIVKDGAIDYYFTELAYLLVIQVGISLYHFATGPKSRPFLFAAFTLQAFIALGMFIGWSQWNATNNYQDAWNEAVSLTEATRQQQQPSLILNDGLLIQTGQYEKVGDYLVYSILLSGGKRDPAPLAADLQARKWQLIITGDPPFYRWPPAISAALDQNYNLRILKGHDGVGIYWVYTPLP